MDCVLSLVPPCNPSADPCNLSLLTLSNLLAASCLCWPCNPSIPPLITHLCHPYNPPLPPLITPLCRPQVFYVVLQFYSPLPKVVTIERRESSSSPWTRWQLYADDCETAFGVPNNGPLTDATSVNCLQFGK